MEEVKQVSICSFRQSEIPKIIDCIHAKYGKIFNNRRKYIIIIAPEFIRDEILRGLKVDTNRPTLTANIMGLINYKVDKRSERWPYVDLPYNLTVLFSTSLYKFQLYEEYEKGDCNFVYIKDGDELQKVCEPKYHTLISKNLYKWDMDALYITTCFDPLI